MATVRPGVLKKHDPDKLHKGEIIYEDVSLLTKRESRINIINSDESEELILLNTPVIVSGGRGLKTAKSFHDLILPLTNIISEKFKTPVQYAGSRGAVDSGFINHDRQVGQTGTTVAPNVYLAIGISGAIQHMVGISKSGIIIAINNDKNAPILKQSDYFLVGNAEKIIPELVSEFTNVRSK